MNEMTKKYKAFRVEEVEGKFSSAIKEVETSPLEEEELLIKVHYSSLNYKDALSATGNKGVTKEYPHTPGIDAVGSIEQSRSARFTVGEKVIVTSYDLGMNTDGGFGEYIKIPSNWAVRLPKKMAMKEAMLLGTAGLTAGMSVARLTASVTPEDGKIVVSGATGGVGSIAVAILNTLGYSVVAITGKESEMAYLKSIGASEIVLRSAFEAFAKRPLLKPLFAGAIDTVGGVILENIIKSTAAMGVVTCCGNVASPKLELTVFPFILRGVTLIGIDSQNYPMEHRKNVWEKLAQEWKIDQETLAYSEVTLEGIEEKIALILRGKLKGRTIITLVD